MTAEKAVSIDVQTWGGGDCRSQKEFRDFLEQMENYFMPWGGKMRPDLHFAARTESLELDRGAIIRGINSPGTYSRSRAHIARSSAECFYILQIVSGKIRVEQAGHTNFAQAGDLLVYDSSQPTIITQDESNSVKYLMLTTPKDKLGGWTSAHDYLSNAIVSRERLPAPLSACLAELAGNLEWATASEQTALFNAAVFLLPVALGFKKNTAKFHQHSSRLHQDMMQYINVNLDNPQLSARQVSEEFDITERYVHALFARVGITFSKYVKDQRLHRIRIDLTETKLPIAVIAHRWGFGDLTTFNRGFKRQFGCTPQEFRMQYR